MKFNTQQIGLDWNSWIRDPENKRLYEWNESEARKKFLMDEEEYIHEVMLHERIETERQQKLQDQLRKLTEIVEDVDDIANMAVTSGEGGMAASGGGGFTSLGEGIGNFAVGTYLTSNFISVGTEAEAGDEGFARFTVA